MKLTGKCKEDFEYWLIRQDNINNVQHSMIGHNQLSESSINAIVIDFFDSVGIYISIDPQREFKNVFFAINSL